MAHLPRRLWFRGGSRPDVGLGPGGSALPHRRWAGCRPRGGCIMGRGVTPEVDGGTRRAKQRCRDRRASRGPAQPRPPGSNRRLGRRGTRRLREAELGRPEADPSITAGGDVEVGPPFRLELSCRGPGLPTGAEVPERSVDALVGPVTLPRRPGAAYEPIRGCATAAYPLEDPGLHELREIVGRLRAANAGDVLILPASQPAGAILGERSQDPLLRGLELDSTLGSSLRHRPSPRGLRYPTIAHHRSGRQCCRALAI
jgi:hypothetical protein